jgi:hypothetical protein
MAVSGQFHAPAGPPRYTFIRMLGGLVGYRVDVDAVVTRKIPCLCQEPNFSRSGKPAHHKKVTD